ncbi:MAG: SH3 domain-containing protein [Chloroflexi bacterium]|nr:SH3 domain-containing protein [Chloroflexota bacterium]
MTIPVQAIIEPTIVLPQSTFTVVAGVTAAPTTAAPPPSFTPMDFVPTVAPTITSIATVTLAPTITSIATVTPLPTSTAGPAVTFGPPATFTPVLFPSYTPTSGPSAYICPTCDQLRLRDIPGTAGNITATLGANLPLMIIGRTEDSVWLQVVLEDGRNGWVAAQYLTVNIDLSVVSVTGTAEDTTGPANIDVVSGVSSNARTIFLDGRAKGNLAHVFTRVGDSISASPNFLFPIGYGNYQLGNFGYLGGAISFFSGPNGRGQNPFAANSIAARNGWSTESVLNPANADPGVCKAGETPLACEYRVNRPAVALIMLGTNDAGGMPSNVFSANLQAIVQTSINMGVIPVLSTIPPKHYNAATDGRVAEFNQLIIATARAYDVPLWNYWLAMSQLPQEGLAADGVHPSVPPDGLNGVFDSTHLQYGFPMRNLTALQVLYILWQQVLYDGDQAPAATVPPVTGPVEVVDPACQALPAPRLTVGGQGRVTPGLPNKVRSQPSTSAEQTGNIPGEGVFQVLAGPQCGDGLWWWQVNYDGLIGWTANGDSAEYWVEPYP